jgi:periplasmic protein CpxP/Spy
MASIATTGLARWPRRRVLLAVLVVSLVLNICFVAGVAWTRMHPPAAAGIETVLQRMPAELDLDVKQRAAFDRYVAEMRTRNEKVRQQVAPLFAGAWEEMAKPGAKTEEVTRQFAEVAGKRQEAQRDTVVQTLEFLSVLSPDQRLKFVNLVRERRSSRRHR